MSKRPTKRGGGRGLRGFDVQAYLDDRIGLKHSADGASGRELVADCPFCGHADKLWANAVTGLWICYKCGENGDAVALVAQLDGKTRNAARTWMVAEAAEAPSLTIDAMRDMMGELAPLQADRPDGPAADLVALPEDFTPVWDAKARVWNALAYLEQRKIRLRTAAAFGLGYCTQGRYANRLILPVTMDGQLVTFQARAMAPGMIPKYLAPAIDKAGSLFGYDQAAMADEVVLVEGPTDVLGVVQAGFNAIGLTGKVISPAQLNAIAKAGYSRVIVMLDPDAAGFDGKATRVLLDRMDTLITRLPAGVDPGNAGRPALEAAIAAARPLRLRDRFRY